MRKTLNLRFRWRQLGIRKSDDGLPGRHGRRCRGSHPGQLEPGQRDVAAAQREPAGARVARRDETPSASARAAAQPPPSPHARSPSAPAPTAAPPRWLHAPVLLVPGRPQPRIAHVRFCSLHHCFFTFSPFSAHFRPVVVFFFLQLFFHFYTFFIR